MIFVLAGDRFAATVHARELRLGQNWEYLNDERKLRGTYKPIVYRCRTFHKLSSHRKVSILEGLRISEAEIIDIDC